MMLSATNISKIALACNDMDTHNRTAYAFDLLTRAQRRANRLQETICVCCDETRFYFVQWGFVWDDLVLCEIQPYPADTH